MAGAAAGECGLVSTCTAPWRVPPALTYLFPLLRRNSYPTQASGDGGNGYQTRRPNPYAQQDDRSYEMADVRDSRTHLTPATPSGTGGGADMSAFYAEVSGCGRRRRPFGRSAQCAGR